MSVAICRSPIFMLGMLFAFICLLEYKSTGLYVTCETPRTEEFTRAKGDAEDSTNVVDLEEEEFSEYISKNSPVLVMFYSPHCGFCQKMKPEYENAATELRNLGTPGKVARVDGTENRDLITKHGIQGYPSVKLFSGDKIYDYRSGRTSEEIVKWFLKMTGSAVKEIADVKDASAEDSDAYFVGRFSSKDAPLYFEFSKLAEELRGTANFHAIFSSSENDSIVAHKPQENDAVFAGEINGLKEFLESESYPALVALHPGNFELYFKRGLDFVWFDGTEDHYKEFSDVIRNIARDYRGKYSFVWVDSSKYAPAGEGEGPRFTINKMNGSRYAMEDPATRLKDADAIRQFIIAVEKGEIPVFLKSEAVPAENDDLVKIVVGKTFKETMYQNKRDVMLEVYAPWCGHCKEFEPAYTEFAKKMKGTNLLVAKMDGTANESPDVNFEWKGFPTIFFMKAGSDKPMLYEGGRTVKDLTQFITEHGTKASSTDGEL